MTPSSPSEDYSLQKHRALTRCAKGEIDWRECSAIIRGIRPVRRETWLERILFVATLAAMTIFVPPWARRDP